MARILLLDDSSTMHRVVRLTFADDQRIEISVARNRAEADQNLSVQKPDLMIAYVRFDGLNDSRYFETLRLVTPRILLLAESEENLDLFSRAGFTRVLRKPFHSDELRLVVEEMLEEDVQTVAQGPEVRPAPEFDLPEIPAVNFATTTESFSSEVSVTEPQITMDLSFLQKTLEPQTTRNPPRSVAPVSAAPQSNPPRSVAPVSAAPQSNPPRSVAPVSAAPQPNPSRSVTPQAQFPRSEEPLAVKPSSSSAFASPPPKSFQPQFPEDEQTISQSVPRPEPRVPASTGRSVGATNDSRLTSMAPPPPPPPPPPTMRSSATREINFSEPPATSSRASLQRGIELAPATSESFDLEDVMVSTKVNSARDAGQSRESGGLNGASGGGLSPRQMSGLSKDEVEKIVEESVATAVNRAVRQALAETLPDLRQALVVEVSQRAVDQLTQELMVVKRTLREQMLEEVRDVSAQWLKRETPNLAKDVIREEIRRVIEQI